MIKASHPGLDPDPLGLAIKITRTTICPAFAMTLIQCAKRIKVIEKAPAFAMTLIQCAKCIKGIAKTPFAYIASLKINPLCRCSMLLALGLAHPGLGPLRRISSWLSGGLILWVRCINLGSCSYHFRLCVYIP